MTHRASSTPAHFGRPGRSGLQHVRKQPRDRRVPAGTVETESRNHHSPTTRVPHVPADAFSPGISRPGAKRLIGDYMDPFTFLSLYVVEGGDNGSGWSDPAFVQKLNDANREHDPAGALRAAAEAEAMLLPGATDAAALQQRHQFREEAVRERALRQPRDDARVELLHIEHDPSKSGTRPQTWRASSSVDCFRHRPDAAHRGVADVGTDSTGSPATSTRREEAATRHREEHPREVRTRQAVGTSSTAACCRTPVRGDFGESPSIQARRSIRSPRIDAAQVGDARYPALSAGAHRRSRRRSHRRTSAELRNRLRLNGRRDVWHLDAQLRPGPTLVLVFALTYYWLPPARWTASAAPILPVITLSG